MQRWANLDSTGVFRYELGRILDELLKRVLIVIGLNPSKADAEIDDATIRVLIGYARRWGFGELVMLNLFSYRSTEPKALWKPQLWKITPVNGGMGCKPVTFTPDKIELSHTGGIMDAVGPSNDEVIARHLKRKDVTVLVAWGANGWWAERDQAVLKLIRQSGHRPMCLAKTKDGLPCHPLRQRADLQLRPYDYKTKDGLHVGGILR